VEEKSWGEFRRKVYHAKETSQSATMIRVPLFPVAASGNLLLNSSFRILENDQSRDRKSVSDANNQNPQYQP
jgi:hypothetical protein